MLECCSFVANPDPAMHSGSRHQHMRQAIRAAAGHLGVALASPDLTEQVTGHSLRATGAQGLARAGVEEWAIQLLGRWGSKAIRLYTRQAALERSSTWARQAGLLHRTGDPLEAVQTTEAALSSTIKRLVAGAVSSFGPGLRAQQASVIKADVLRELREQGVPIIRPSSSDQATDPGERYVKNVATGITHRVAGNLDGAISSWVTACGWHYASKSNTDFLALSEPPRLHKMLCEKCLPKERHFRKSALQHAMGRQVGGQ